MRRAWKKPILLGGVLVVGMGMTIGGLLGGGDLLAQVAIPSTEEGSTMKKQARITAFLKNDHDDVDGLELDSGDRVHFPPHMAKKIMAIAKVGDSVEIEGRTKIRPKGDQVLEIHRLTCGNEMVRVVHPRPKHDERVKNDEPSMSVEGKVTALARNPHGDIDGLMLQEGTIVKFPPHQSSDLQELVQVGDEVEIEGRRHVTPHGEVHLHADIIRANGKTVEREGPKRGPKPPKHSTWADDSKEPTNVEILRELREIRKMLSERR
ncbi:hypothetical protein VN12_05360 [Pirellula sp. SH-Sr6A]|uniref:OB-fold nucleic acid binding domain-containing protein n=1 Tax=Pirellula sp. SH-Sr6A TaxID=1632865 RepID=UPI00078DECDF|nr:OB-fold nucleic acid binding domain-containing protein [Pirellula sp. SH-Sr6A]AMV31525.1 hypothetical protein VN12_05360 [Pirellula sp. SH-Sr6A]